jgi:hypothetical protein
VSALSQPDEQPAAHDADDGEWTRERYAALLQQRRDRGFQLPYTDEPRAPREPSSQPGD